MVNKMWREINKAGKMGAGGGANTWGLGWLGEPKILVKCLVMGATVKRGGGL